MHGGPMYTIKHGLGKAFLPLAAIYSFFTILSSMGAGNMFQANSVAGAMEAGYGIPIWGSGLLLCFLSWLVLIGGIKRIANVAGKLVPAMVVFYFIGAMGIIVTNLEKVPAMFGLIFAGAFSGTAAIGGFAGATIREVLIQGVRRAVFSNEAGMGSAAMAHSAAKTEYPVREGIVGSLGPFIDTIVVCTLTALVMLLTDAWKNPGDLSGAALTAAAFGQVYGDWGRILVDVSVLLFAFSTIISWSYYGEQGVTYLAGTKWIVPYRYVFIAFTMLGAVWKLQPVLDISDAVFGLMAIPNLIANLLLVRTLSGETDKYVKDLQAGKFPRTV